MEKSKEKDSISREKEPECKQLNANAKLCRLTKAHPCIYDRSASNNLTTKEKEYFFERAWAKIALEMKDTVYSCKERWRNICTAYSNSRNINKSNLATNNNKPFYLHDELQFLNKHLSPVQLSLRVLTPLELEEIHANSRPSIDQSDENCTFEINRDTSSPLPSVHEEIVPIPDPESELEIEPEHQPDRVKLSTSAKKRSRSISEEFTIVAKQHKTDPDSEFLNSLLPEMKSMNSRQKILFKGKIFEALGEVFSDSKDFPKKVEPSVIVPQSSSQTPDTPPKTLKTYTRRVFGNKTYITQREKQAGISGQTIRVPISIQLPESQNKTIKQENEIVQVDD